MTRLEKGFDTLQACDVCVGVCRGICWLPCLFFLGGFSDLY